MSNWADKYLGLITSTHKQNIVLEDQDSLLQYGELKELVTAAGYRLFEAKSEFDVRLIYELQVNGNGEKHIIVAPAGYRPLPDMGKNVHFQSVGLARLFPNLDASAIKGLSYNALCVLSNIRPYEELGQERTLKFLLENLYNVDFDTLTQNKPKERILNALITALLERNGINDALLRFLSRLCGSYLPGLLTKGLSRQNLVAFLQQQWDAYVKNEPVEFDFEEPLLSKSIGYLFVFELLKATPVSAERLKALPGSLRIGAFVDLQQNNDNELEGLIQYLEQQAEYIEDLYDQWFTLVQVMANAKLKVLLTNDPLLQARYDAVETSLNSRFQRFIENTYNSLYSLTGIRRPVVVSRILEYINSQPQKRKALMVIDGMNYWQWNLLSHALTESGLSVSQGTTMAFIPTITAWSRQAIFKGARPDLTTGNEKEAVLFTDYWKKNGYAGYEVGFARFGVKNNLDAAGISQSVNVLGLVCKDLDDIMHGSILGDRQLKASTLEWIRQSNVVEQVRALRHLGFTIYITSDHGNIEARGIKSIGTKEKVGALSRSKRHLFYDNEVMLSAFREANPGIEYGVRSLSVYLKDKSAFTEVNSAVITHGGSHLWEVLVPFISIK